MSHSKELYALLTETIIPEVEGFISSMNQFLENNESTDEIEQDKAGIHAIYENFLDIKIAIEEGNIEEENCKQLIEELTMLRAMGNQAGVNE
jgi:hypothetical protein